MVTKIMGYTINKTLKKESLLKPDEFKKKATEAERVEYAWMVYNSNLSKYKPKHKDAAFSYLQEVFQTDSVKDMAALMALKHKNPDKGYVPALSELSKTPVATPSAGKIASPPKVAKSEVAAKVAEGFTQGNVIDVVDSFKQLNNKVAYLPEMGPLPKSKYTYEYEELTRRLIAGEKFNYKQDANHHILEFRNKRYDLTEIVAHANLDHLTFNQFDLNRYETYCRNDSQVKPENEDEEFPEDAYFKQQDKNNIFKDTSYAEKLALNIYTTDYYEKMNPFLRGYYDFSTKTNAEIRDVIVHSALCGFALGKAPNVEIDGAFRYEGIYSQDVLANRIKISEEGGAEVLRGFISTAEEPAHTFKDQVAITYTDLKGKYVAPLSRYPEEREFLIPPTQMTYEGHVKKDGVHYFHAKPVIDIALVDEKTKSLASKNDINTAKIQELLLQLSHLDALIKQNCSKSDYQIHRGEIASIKNWAIQEGDKLQKGVASANLSEHLANMWEKLSNLSQHAAESSLEQQLQQRAIAERQVAQYEKFNDALAVCNLRIDEFKAALQNPETNQHLISAAKKMSEAVQNQDAEGLVNIAKDLEKKLTDYAAMVYLQAAGKELEKFAPDKIQRDVILQEMQTKFKAISTREELAQQKEEIKLAAVKNDCNKSLQRIEEYETSGNKDKITSLMQQMEEKLNKANSIASVFAVKDEMEKELSPIKSEFKINELKAISNRVLAEIDQQHRIGKDKNVDVVMNNFVKEYEGKIKQAKSEDEIVQIVQTLHDTRKILEQNKPVVEQAKTIIEELPKKQTLFTFGLKEKASAIEHAMVNVPLTERGDILTSQSPEALEVRKAMATQRTIFSNKTHLNHNEVDEKKAATTFKNFKAQVSQMKQEGKASLKEEKEAEQQFIPKMISPH
ncbi:hypothetical protein [Legionella septentrionalis]|uniref:hypothetical protein n=1 Tax=Legionella septentrionalis TaxID=2498109 RepID=UPI000F8EB0BC|nr:hypothetical protein [Legionella septentrionalis]RUR14535.1 hypothetical protein ELY10_08435 [Legionella septentrionalis]